ncbi:MAG: signal peptidase II [Bdellovibrionales bacterium]|nr:signal peptidase II [Bdellovibrionales bacterium]
MPRRSSESTEPTLSLRAKILWIIGVIAIDRWTKVLAIDHIKDHPPRIYFGDFFRMEYAENPGAFLSLGAGLSADTRFWVFAVAVAAFLLGATWVLFRERKLDRITAFSLSVIIGGGVGNLIDRTTRMNHGVVDFLNMGFGNFRTGIFNVADMAIMLGVILLAWKSFAVRPAENRARGDAAQETKST